MISLIRPVIAILALGAFLQAFRGVDARADDPDKEKVLELLNEREKTVEAKKPKSVELLNALIELANQHAQIKLSENQVIELNTAVYPNSWDFTGLVQTSQNYLQLALKLQNIQDPTFDASVVLEPVSMGRNELLPEGTLQLGGKVMANQRFSQITIQELLRYSQSYDGYAKSCAVGISGECSLPIGKESMSLRLQAVYDQVGISTGQKIKRVDIRLNGNMNFSMSRLFK